MVKKLWIVILTLVLINLAATPGFALSQAQQNVYDSGIPRFNIEESPRSIGPGISPLTEAEIIKFISFSGPTIDPTGIVLHWTGGSPSQSVEDFVAGIGGRRDDACPDGCSVQFYVDGSGSVYQLVDPINTLTAHAAGANDCCIGIEIAGTGAIDLLGNNTQKTNVARLVHYIAQLFSIPTSAEAVDVDSRIGILSHHLISPDRKQDVGDEYHQEIITLVNSSGANGPGLIDEAGLPTIKYRYEEVYPSMGSGPKANVDTGQQLAAPYGWNSGNQFICLFDLWYRESGWNERADNPASSAYGIPQALPGSKMATAGDDWETNPATQITWGLSYLESRYQTPCEAIIFHNANNWY